MSEEEQEPDTGTEQDTDAEDTSAEMDWEAEAKKWKALSRKHESSAKQNAAAAAKLKEHEDAQKSKEQQAADKAAEAERRATSAEQAALRLEVALDKAPEGMSVAQVRKLAKRLAGSSREEMESDAEDLFADFEPAGGSSDDDRGSRRRPRERLRSGAAPDAEPDETDPAKLAAQVPRMY